MKILFSTVLIVLLTFAVALADWQETFKTDYESVGIDQAVINALKEGISVEQIVESGLLFEGLNPQLLLKALYCAGANGEDIKQFALLAGLSELLLNSALEQSIAECSDQLADTQAYAQAGPTFSSAPGSTPAGSVGLQNQPGNPGQPNPGQPGGTGGQNPPPANNPPNPGPPPGTPAASPAGF